MLAKFTLLSLAALVFIFWACSPSDPVTEPSSSSFETIQSSSSEFNGSSSSEAVQSSSSIAIAQNSSSSIIQSSSSSTTNSLSSTTQSSSSIAQSSSSIISSSSAATSSSSVAQSSSSTPAQATTCKTPLITYPANVPAEPYTACFKYTDGKCYVCKVSSEGEYQGNVNTCHSSWVWDGSQIASNLESGYWYQEVSCPATGASSSSQGGNNVSSSSNVSSGGPCTTKACIDDEINANYSRLGYKTKPTQVIALSFDDGPCPETQGLLNALANKGVKTTFFLIGSNIRGNKTAAQAIYTAGHELANHSDGYSENPNQTSVQACSNEIKNITGSNPTLFRAPGVNYGGGAVDNVCKNLNLAMIDVSCWSNDYDKSNSATIRSRVKACAGDGKIVNLHEFNTASGNNAAGIEGLIDDLRAAGYWILPVGQMAIYKNKTLVGGTKYSNF